MSRNEIVSIRFTEDERTQLGRVAARMGVKPAQLIRQWALERLNPSAPLPEGESVGAPVAAAWSTTEPVTTASGWVTVGDNTHTWPGEP